METGTTSSAAAASTQAQRQAHYEEGIALAIFLWQALSVVVANNAGGNDSDKREWFAGVAQDELVKADADLDEEWIEVFLIQVMEDEFDTVVDDGSAFDIAQQILKLRKDCASGNFKLVDEMRARWKTAQGKNYKVAVEERDNETDGSADEDDDVDMDETPPPVRVREPAVPEVDEDGFTKVTKKR